MGTNRRTMLKRTAAAVLCAAFLLPMALPAAVYAGDVPAGAQTGMQAGAQAGTQAGMPEGAIQMIPRTGHDAVSKMLKMNQFIDLVIPRGGERLIRAVVEQATMPVMTVALDAASPMLQVVTRTALNPTFTVH